MSKFTSLFCLSRFPIVCLPRPVGGIPFLWLMALDDQGFSALTSRVAGVFLISCSWTEFLWKFLIVCVCMGSLWTVGKRMQRCGASPSLITCVTASAANRYQMFLLKATLNIKHSVNQDAIHAHIMNCHSVSDSSLMKPFTSIYLLKQMHESLYQPTQERKLGNKAYQYLLVKSKMLRAYTSIYVVKSWRTNRIRTRHHYFRDGMEDMYTLEFSTAKYEDGIFYSAPRSQLSLLTLHLVSPSASSRFQPKGPWVHLPPPVTSGQIWLLSPFIFRKWAYDIPTNLSFLLFNSFWKKNEILV